MKEIEVKYLFMGIIKLYQTLISPFLASSCRFYPTCSNYSYQAFNKHGFFKGFYLSINRILRCNPFNSGGIDEVPEHFHMTNIFKVSK